MADEKQITKDVFFKFLKDNNFYDAWIEGFNLDNEIYDDDVPLDEFLNDCETRIWLYSGPGILSRIPQWTEDFNPELIRRHTEWREKYMSQYMDLDEKWMAFVNKIMGL